MLRFRVDTELFDQADRISSEMGTSTPNLVRMFLTALVKERALPFKVSADPEDAVTGPWKQRAEVIESFYDKSKTW